MLPTARFVPAAATPALTEAAVPCHPLCALLGSARSARALPSNAPRASRAASMRCRINSRMRCRCCFTLTATRAVFNASCSTAQDGSSATSAVCAPQASEQQREEKKNMQLSITTACTWRQGAGNWHAPAAFFVTGAVACVATASCGKPLTNAARMSVSHCKDPQIRLNVFPCTFVSSAPVIHRAVSDSGVRTVAVGEWPTYRSRGAFKQSHTTFCGDIVHVRHKLLLYRIRLVRMREGARRFCKHRFRAAQRQAACHARFAVIHSLCPDGGRLAPHGGYKRTHAACFFTAEICERPSRVQRAHGGCVWMASRDCARAREYSRAQNGVLGGTMDAQPASQAVHRGRVRSHILAGGISHLMRWHMCVCVRECAWARQTLALRHARACVREDVRQPAR